jgi:hypothetical protein
MGQQPPLKKSNDFFEVGVFCLKNDKYLKRKFYLEFHIYL